MRPLRPLAVLVVASFLLAACGSDTPSASPSSSGAASTPTSAAGGKSVETDPTVPEVSTPAATAPATSTSSGPQQCARQGDITIKIVLGNLDCVSAYDVADRVDRDGDKRQTVSGYVCEFGNATIRPTIFTCTNRGRGTEFAVDET